MEEVAEGLDRESCNVLPDGSCMFYSVMFAYLLPKIWDYGIFRDACRRLFGDLEEELIQFLRVRLLHFNWDGNFLSTEYLITNLVELKFRIKLMDWLRGNPGIFPVDYVREDNVPESLDGHIERMSRPKEYGEEIELRAMSEMLGIRINIIDENNQFLTHHGEYQEVITIMHTYADINEKEQGRNHYYFCIDKKEKKVLDNHQLQSGYYVGSDGKDEQELIEELNGKIDEGEEINFTLYKPMFVALFFGEHFDRDLYTDEQMQAEIVSPSKSHPMLCPAVFNKDIIPQTGRKPRHNHGSDLDWKEAVETKAKILAHRKAHSKLDVPQRNAKHQKFVNTYPDYLNEHVDNIYIPVTPVPARALRYARNKVTDIYPNPRITGTAIGKVRVFIIELPVLQQLIKDGYVISQIQQEATQQEAFHPHYLYDLSYDFIGGIPPENVIGEVYVSSQDSTENIIINLLVQLAQDEAKKRSGFLVNLDANGQIFRGLPCYADRKYSNAANVVTVGKIRDSALKLKKSPQDDEEFESMRRSLRNLSLHAAQYDPASRNPKPKKRGGGLLEEMNQAEDFKKDDKGKEEADDSAHEQNNGPKF